MAAISLARAQSTERDDAFVTGLARNALNRSEVTGHQLSAAAAAINRLTPADACSDKSIDLMRQIDLGSTLLQGVGWIEGDRIECSSFAGRQTFDLGPAELQSTTGTKFRTQVTLFDPKQPYLAVQAGHSIGIVHKDLALSFVDDIPGLAVSTFSWSKREPLLSRGDVPLALIKRDFRGNTVFRAGGKLVGVVKSSEYDLGAIVVLPSGQASDYAGETALVLIPIGVFVGLLLSAVLVHVIRTRASMPMMIRMALKRGKFHLLYQPVVDLQTGKPIGVEALIRWDRGANLEIPPDRFIPVAEEAGLIPLVTARVLELLAEDARHILRITPGFHFSVNFAAQDMHRTNILDEVSRLIERSGIKFENLVIEATERSLVDVELAQANLRQLRDAGVKVAIDDFGTGYSSLAYLAQLEVDYLKIDKLFVQALGTDSATNQVAARIIQMAKDLDIKIVAEGIESRQQERLLKALKVELAQGYLYGKPMPLDDLLPWLRAERQSARAARNQQAA
jgi:sensor c-di-GMP phosphodiesterase-like protein